jgi:hypothetical protein
MTLYKVIGRDTIPLPKCRDYPDQTMSFYSVELPYHKDVARYYAALADLPWAAWLDSAGMGRYDILTAAPQRTLLLDEGIAHG